MEEFLENIANNFVSSLIKLDSKGIKSKDVAITIRNLKATLKFNKEALLDSQRFMNPEIIRVLTELSKDTIYAAETFGLDKIETGKKIRTIVYKHLHPIAIEYKNHRQKIKDDDLAQGIDLENI